jgi:hypothetical protein
VVFSSETTDSTSRNAASRRSVRLSSADLRVAVSAESWSRRAKARANSASMEALSCSSWGGVGGETMGVM